MGAGCFLITKVCRTPQLFARGGYNVTLYDIDINLKASVLPAVRDKIQVRD